MDEAILSQYMVDTFAGLDVVGMPGAIFFFYDPDKQLAPEKRMPFVTIVNTDDFDQASQLSRPSIYRVNVGVRKETYRALFGPQPAYPDGNGVVDTGHDFTTLDQLMPHPVYAAASWICVLNPSESTFQQLQPLIEEAYRIAVERHDHLVSRS